jgi:hypothetical protein
MPKGHGGKSSRYGGGPVLGDTQEPDDAPTLGRFGVTSYGGAPATAAGYRLTSGPSGETYPSAYGGAPTFAKGKTPKTGSGSGQGGVDGAPGTTTGGPDFTAQ